MKTHKYCPTCDSTVPVSEFYKNSARHDGLGTVCRRCHNVETAARQARLRQQAIAALGQRCARCDFADYRALVIDHRNGGGAAERRTLSCPSTYYRHVAVNPGAYELLCANCNTIKAVEQGEHTGPRPRRLRAEDANRALEPAQGTD